MKRYLERLGCLAMVVILGGLVIAAAGCGRSGGDYSLVQTAFSGADIIYSYPDTYRMPPGGPGNSSLTYLRYLGKVEDLDSDRMIFIETLPPAGAGDAAAQMDKDLNSILDSTLDFRLIKRTTTSVAGYDAELLAFSATFPDTPLTSRTTTTWVAYFFRDGLIWEMGVMTNADLEGAAEADFKALVASFAFE